MLNQKFEKKFHIATGIISILVAIYCFSINPKLLIWPEFRELGPNKPNPPPAILFAQAMPPVGNVISQYRGGAHRLGQVQMSMRKKLQLINLRDGLNQGIHTASKATPAIDSTGIYLGTDQGVFYALDLRGQTRWQFFASDADRGFHSTAILTDESVFVGAYNGTIYRFDKKSGELLWSLMAGIAIGASPVLADGFLYVAIETSEPNGFLAKISAQNGELIWTSPWLGDQTHSSPTVDQENQLVILGDNTGCITAFDLTTGLRRWSYQTAGPVKGTSPLSRGQLIYSSWDGKIISLEAKSGKLLWQTHLGGSLQSSATLTPDGKNFIIGGPEGQVCFFTTQTGQKISCSESASKASNHGSALLTVSKDENESYFWISCQGERALCQYSAKSLSLIKSWPLQSELTGIPTAYDQNIYFSLNRSPGLMVLK